MSQYYLIHNSIRSIPPQLDVMHAVRKGQRLLAIHLEKSKSDEQSAAVLQSGTRGIHLVSFDEQGEQPIKMPSHWAPSAAWGQEVSAAHLLLVRQVVMHHGRAVNGEWLAFAQAEQAGHVIDLTVHQNDGRNAGVADAAIRLQLRKRANLCRDVRRSVDQDPGGLFRADSDRGLGARLGAQSAEPQALAVGTVTIPLRETTARG